MRPHVSWTAAHSAKIFVGRGTQRSAYAFRFGLLAGSMIGFTPAAASADRNEAQNFLSRSYRAYRVFRRQILIL